MTNPFALQGLDPAVIRMAFAARKHCPPELLDRLRRASSGLEPIAAPDANPEPEPAPAPPSASAEGSTWEQLVARFRAIEVRRAGGRREADFEPPGARIRREVAVAYGVTVLDLRSARRTRRVARARQCAMYRMATETVLSLPQIGGLLNRDHTTVLHGIRAHAARHGLPDPTTYRSAHGEAV